LSSKHIWYCIPIFCTIFFNPQLDAEIKPMDLVHLISTGLDNEIPSHRIESRYDLFRGEKKRVCDDKGAKYTRFMP
jgi:hypothetical protein